VKFFALSKTLLHPHASVWASGLEVCVELFVLSFAILYFIRNFARG
jgi:hypothetical protein